MSAIYVELVKILPSLAWFVLVIVLLVVFYKPIRDELLPRLSGLKAMGVEFSFVKESLDAAVQLAEKNPKWKVEIPAGDREYALRRAKQHTEVFRRAQILWVDDHPENNLNERRMFRQLNAEIDTAQTTDEALGILMNHDYDLVISDMARGDDAAAGLDFLRRLRDRKRTTPLIFYVGVIDPRRGVPAQAFGVTNRPDELLHLALDALERKSY